MLESERSLYERRVGRFLGRLESLFYEMKTPFSMEYSSSETPVPFDRRLDAEFQAIRIGEAWGKTWSSAWFHLQAAVPQSWKGAHVAALLNFTGEACIFSGQGEPIQGLTGFSTFNGSFTRDRYSITPSSRGGEAVDLWIETAANGMFGVELKADPSRDDPDRHGTFDAVVKDAYLAIFREDIWHLYLDCAVLNDLMLALPEKSVRRFRILRRLNDTIDAFLGDPENVGACRRVLADELEKPACASALTTAAVGHAHIDTGWLWPVRETVRKCGRTFASQIALMEKYPRHVFGASQAQHYAFVKEHYPALYARVKEKVKQGRWEIQGAMWVESDNNLVSGESLVRQILHGKNFFRDEFGVDVRNLWLPDVFGYSAALPQILRDSGVDYFVTQKISWSQFNRFPHHTFIWRGIDGSEVIAHFPPEDTYNSELRPKGLIYAQENFAERGFLDEFMTLFGVGDGGGGPKEEHIEMGLRQADLEGSPRVRIGPAQDMLDRLGEQRERLETWVGELYLELHRGTLTTQAENKKMNRRLEGRLRQVEVLFSCLPLGAYPASRLDGLWKRLLVNQFHDILPGSSIHQVYVDSRRDYRQIDEAVDGLAAEAMAALLTGRRDALAVINTLSYPYTRALTLPEGWRGCEIRDEKGAVVEVQEEGDRAVVNLDVPQFAGRTLFRGEAGKTEKTPEGQALSLENGLIRYEFDENGRLVRAWDKEAQREVIGETGNVLSLYEDRPVEFDAWDIDLFYENQLLEQARLASRRSIQGPIRQVLLFDLRVGESTVLQRVVLGPGSRRLDFETTVDWRERHKMLRVAFPVAIHSQIARFDTQFGTIERTTHRNTLWDRARFEVCGHRFADLSEAHYGVALLNDCKYGYKVHDGELNLNLLRSPTSPDPDADMGTHHFTYTLLPHPGSLVDSDVWSEAAQLNGPPAVFDGADGTGFRFPVSLRGRGVVWETLKKAEREDALILRAYETRGCPAEARLEAQGFRVFETDLMENDKKEFKAMAGSLDLAFRPFQIRTFKLRGRS